MSHIDPLDFLGILAPLPPGFTRFCGSCGAVWGGCGCERKRVVAEASATAAVEYVLMDYGVEAVQPVPAPVVEPPTKEETWRDRPGML